MNGSAVFLLAALKMRLGLAARPWSGTGLPRPSQVGSTLTYSYPVNRPWLARSATWCWCVSTLAVALVVQPAFAETPEPHPTDAWVDDCLDRIEWSDPASFAGECVRLAQDEKRFGDVLVAFLPRRQEVRVAATKSLGKRYEQCVLNALGSKDHVHVR
jgi:hypothetical protein